MVRRPAGAQARRPCRQACVTSFLRSALQQWTLPAQRPKAASLSDGLGVDSPLFLFSAVARSKGRLGHRNSSPPRRSGRELGRTASPRPGPRPHLSAADRNTRPQCGRREKRRPRFCFHPICSHKLSSILASSQHVMRIFLFPAAAALWPLKARNNFALREACAAAICEFSDSLPFLQTSVRPAVPRSEQSHYSSARRTGPLNSGTRSVAFNSCTLHLRSRPQ